MPDESPPDVADTVAALSELYLGNILYALERTAMDLDGEGKVADGRFYRGIARKLADAHGKSKKQDGRR